MNLLEKIESDYIVAYKAKDAVRLGALRLLKTAVKNMQVERARQPVTDADVMDVILKQCKQRQDSIEQYTAAKRQDLADREAAELAVLEGYLPERMSGAALDAAVANIIAETGAAGPKDMGKVMQALAAAHKGSYDGKEASERVRAALRKG